MHHQPPLRSFNLMIVMPVLALAAISCSQFKQIVAPNKQSDAVNTFNFSIPADRQNSFEDPPASRHDALTILVNGEGEIRLGEIASEPVALSALADRVNAFAAGKSEYKKKIFIAAAATAPSQTIINIINELRKCDIKRIGLLTRTRTKSELSEKEIAEYDLSLGDISAPDRVFEVDLTAKSYSEDKPNPLTLVVNAGSSGTTLNSQPVSDKALSSKLTEIFKSREENGLLREGTNEVEKTVLFKLDASEQKQYADIVGIVDILKGAGSSPIVLIDDTMIPDRPADIIIRDLKQ